MILPFLAALLTALGPLLQGVADSRAQSFLHLTTAFGLSLWLSLRILIGHIPLPSSRTLWWIGVLAVLGTLSASLSPIPHLSRLAWWNFLNALWIFPAMAALTKDRRHWIDEAIRVSAWILMLLAFYQRIRLDQARPASVFADATIYAGAILMLLPIALERRDHLLTIGLLWNLWWSRSLGAWLGLSLVLVLTQRGKNPLRFWTGTVIALICSITLYAQLGTPEVLERWECWKTALHIIQDHPFMGTGPGTFLTFANGHAYHYFLQTAAELGVPFCLLWIAGLWRCVGRDITLKRLGIVAIGIESLWNNTLSTPSNLWLLSYLAASSIPDNPEGINIPARLKLPLAFVVLGLGAALCAGILKAP